MTQTSNELAISGTSSTGLVLSNDTMDKAFRMAELMASGRATVPKHLQGSAADCMAVTLQALQWNMSPFAVAQKTHLVNGTLGYEAQLIIAVLQSTGAIVGEFEYEYQGDGDNLQCRAGATPRGKTQIKWGEWLALKSITTKNSPLWKTNPRQQIAYLQAKNWSRLYTPGAILGVYTPDELSSPQPIEKHMGPVDEVKDPYPQDQFEANFLKWKEVITGGRKTADQLIAFTYSRNPNLEFTEEQIKKLRALDLKPAATAQQEVTDVQLKSTPAADAPALSPEKLQADMAAATDLEKLYELGSLLDAIPDEAQRLRLNEVFDARVAELEGQ
ncbi:recombinase RecT [Comamonas sp.]|uniref:recombinase RecT n=1 Tax=Comamonas sp. TaxID=34028 RepID=UPI0028A7649C|nr:recombinase RecT [Comamonas sp.]